MKLYQESACVYFVIIILGSQNEKKNTDLYNVHQINMNPSSVLDNISFSLS